LYCNNQLPRTQVRLAYTTTPGLHVLASRQQRGA
jgi:hypothetical protein